MNSKITLHNKITLRQRVVNISIIFMYCNRVKGIVTRGDVTVKGACGS